MCEIHLSSCGNVRWVQYKCSHIRAMWVWLADIAREITLADLTHTSGDVPETGNNNALMCVAAGGDHAAIWIDSSSSAAIADDRRSTKPLRFDDCSLPKKCEIAVMGHDPVLLNDCIQVWLVDQRHNQSTPFASCAHPYSRSRCYILRAEVATPHPSTALRVQCYNC